MFHGVPTSKYWISQIPEPKIQTNGDNAYYSGLKVQADEYTIAFLRL